MNRFPPEPLVLDDTLSAFNEDQVMHMNRRLFLELERDLTALEHAPFSDPRKNLRESLDLLERALRIRRLMDDAYPKRARKKRNRAGGRKCGRCPLRR